MVKTCHCSSVLKNFRPVDLGSFREIKRRTGLHADALAGSLGELFRLGMVFHAPDVRGITGDGHYWFLSRWWPNKGHPDFLVERYYNLIRAVGRHLKGEVSVWEKEGLSLSELPSPSQRVH